jgi:hypothetical protein
MKKALKLKAFMLSMVMGFALLPMNMFAQSSDDFFCVDDAFNGNRDVVAFTLNNQEFVDTPVGSGLAILLAASAGYAVVRRRKNGKSAMFIIAGAIMIATCFTQCKKNVETIKPVTGEKIQISLKVANDGKHDVIIGVTGKVNYENGDVIYVGDGTKYIGTLTMADDAFSGTIDTPSGSDLYFYFIGGAPISPSALTAGTTSYTVDISDQTGNLPVLSLGHVEYVGSKEYTCTLENKCALVELTLTSGTTDAVGIGDRYTQATINFGGTPGIVPNTETTGMIKMKPSGDNTKKYAILLPQAAVNKSNIAIGHVGYTLDVPAMSNNNYIKFNNEGAVESNIVYLNYLTTHYTAYDGKTLTGTLAGNYIISIAPGATLTLNNATINGTNNSSYKWAGINCIGTATIILKDGTTNTVRGFYDEYPGIHVPSGSTLTIKGETAGTGSLSASSNGWATGIGGGGQGDGIDCGNIVIQSGVITATGGQYSAAIGSGTCKSCGTITISGGTVTATGGSHSAAIGTGQSGTCGDITITTGVTRVTATRGANNENDCVGRGDGTSYCSKVTIGDRVCWEVDYYPYGGYNVIQTNQLIYPTPAPSVTDLATITENYTASDGEILTGKLGANVKISIAAGATVTLDNADINGDATWKTGNYAGLSCLGDATIILKDGTTSTVKGFQEDYPGIHVPSGSTLIVKGETAGTGELYASGNPIPASGTGAGIGGGWSLACGNIEIRSGVIHATGLTGAAGIGSSNNGCGNITITGGTITAQGGASGAGIGSGNDGTGCGNITITGGTVTATGGESGAGIGTGRQGRCADITIAGTVTRVTATMGDGASYSIGRGYGGSCGTVTIGGDEGSISTSPYIYAPLTWGSGFISSISLNGSGNVSQGGIKASLSGIADNDKFTSSNIDLESGTLTFEIESGGAYESYSIKKIEIYYDGPLGSISGTPSDGWSVNTSEKIVTWSGTSTTVSLRSANPASEWLYIGDIPHIVFHLHK